MNKYWYKELIEVNVKYWINNQNMAKFYNKKYNFRLSFYDLLITIQQTGSSFRETCFWITQCPISSAERWRLMGGSEKLPFLKQMK